MSKIDLMAPIDGVHGKLFGNDCKLSFGKRTERNKEGEKTNFSLVRAKRKDNPTSLQIQKRQDFSTRAKQVKNVMQDLQLYATWHGKYAKQSEYVSFKSYLWAQAKAGQLPTVSA